MFIESQFSLCNTLKPALQTIGGADVRLPGAYKNHIVSDRRSGKHAWPTSPTRVRLAPSLVRSHYAEAEERVARYIRAPGVSDKRDITVEPTLRYPHSWAGRQPAFLQDYSCRKGLRCFMWAFTVYHRCQWNSPPEICCSVWWRGAIIHLK